MRHQELDQISLMRETRLFSLDNGKASYICSGFSKLGEITFEIDTNCSQARHVMIIQGTSSPPYPCLVFARELEPKNDRVRADVAPRSPTDTPKSVAGSAFSMSALSSPMRSPAAHPDIVVRIIGSPGVV
jgi:hypothetical protein